MRITDIKGKYQLEVSEGGTIVHETINDTYRGLWNEADFRRMHADYVSKIYPLVKGKEWVKCVDMINYKTSNIDSAMTQHLEWAAKNGMHKGCIVTDSLVNQMQIESNAGGKDSPICPDVFTSKEKAVEWLHSGGYTG